MRKVIEGLVYDTETAEEVTSWSNSYPVSDFNHCSETLYRTKNGRWFIYGEGGPMSKYAESVGGDRGAGEDILPMSPGEVRDWLEDHNMIDVMEEHFSEHLQEA